MSANLIYFPKPFVKSFLQERPCNNKVQTYFILSPLEESIYLWHTEGPAAYVNTIQYSTVESIKVHRHVRGQPITAYTSHHPTL